MRQTAAATPVAGSGRRPGPSAIGAAAPKQIGNMQNTPFGLKDRRPHEQQDHAAERRVGARSPPPSTSPSVTDVMVPPLDQGRRPNALATRSKGRRQTR